MPTDSEVIASSHGEILADHSQIFLYDCAFDFGGEADLDLLYNEESTDRHLGVAPDVLAIFTAKHYGTVPLDLIGRAGPPSDDFSDWDNVVEASLDLPSGCVLALAPEMPEGGGLRIMLPAGMYRARIYAGGIDTVDEYMMEGQDHYCVVLWPALFTEPILLRGESGALW
ncbi:MAG TPA: hypothetical protein VH349_18230 [Ktedonobacterales bacterium]|jgi:hypothetical protein